ncbi:MAG: NAD(P)/FAD-dependent oxidoreductase [Candidatus Micrarchaeota archaeon]
MHDLHVIGAGPAGCVAALSAIRKHNARVTISEEHECVGVPANCSGLFSVDGLETLRDYVDYRGTVINDICGAVIDLCGEKITVKRKNAVAHVCNRALLDLRIAENAEKEGAEIRYGERISTGIVDRFKTDNIIGADGPNSFVARSFGFPKIGKFVATAQTTVRYAAEDPHMVEVFLSNSMFPGFFGWVIPHNEEKAEFGCGIKILNRGTNVMDALDLLLKMKNIVRNKNINGERNKGGHATVKCAIIPIETRKRTAMRRNGKNVLLVGDAAGQTKSTTGGGVIIGGNCARIAGENFDNPLGYEIKWRAKFGADLFIHSFVNRYLSAKSDAELKQLGARLRTSGLERFLSKHGHMDRPTRMITPGALGRLLGNAWGLRGI